MHFSLLQLTLFVHSGTKVAGFKNFVTFNFVYIYKILSVMGGGGLIFSSQFGIINIKALETLFQAYLVITYSTVMFLLWKLLTFN